MAMPRAVAAVAPAAMRAAPAVRIAATQHADGSISALLASWIAPASSSYPLSLPLPSPSSAPAAILPSLMPVPAPASVPASSPLPAAEGVWCVKRPYTPNVLKRKRKHGFLKRKSTADGLKTLTRRRVKGRHRLSA